MAEEFTFRDHIISGTKTALIGSASGVLTAVALPHLIDIALSLGIELLPMAVLTVPVSGYMISKAVRNNTVNRVVSKARASEPLYSQLGIKLLSDYTKPASEKAEALLAIQRINGKYPLRVIASELFAKSALCNAINRNIMFNLMARPRGYSSPNPIAYSLSN